MTSPPEVLPISTVCKMFGLTQQTVVKMISDGQLHGTRLGRNWRVTAESVDQLRAKMSLPRIYTQDPGVHDPNIPIDEEYHETTSENLLLLGRLYPEEEE